MKSIFSTPPRRLLAKKTLIFCIVVNLCVLFYAQNYQDYYIVGNPDINLEPIQSYRTTTNSTSIITVDLVDNELEVFLNNKQMLDYKQTFPTAQTPYLRRVYTVRLSDDSHLASFSTHTKIEYVEYAYEGIPLEFPDDYGDEQSLENSSSQLDIIKANLAWNITQGDSNILVGVSDNGFDYSHEDLINEIVSSNGNSVANHGTNTAGLLSASTDNGIGIASIGYNTKIVTGPISASSALTLSQIPGVRIINGSWGGCFGFNQMDAMCFEEIWNNGVIPIFAAGNGAGINGCETEEEYAYPASYEHTISVTSVGHTFPIGTNHPTHGERWWKDVHEYEVGVASNQHNDKVDICAPGYHVWTTGLGNTYGFTGGTSSAAPMVAGLAALIFSINPNFTPQEVKDIIQDTADDIYHIPQNQPYIGQLGTGRINAYRAVLTADCMTNPTTGLDLAMQNSKEDYFEEPDIDTQQPWKSDDIWVRNQNDGVLACGQHQNPEYDPNNPNYAYVQVTNNSCDTSSGNDVLKLYWAKASTSLAWPDPWDGSVTIYDEVDDVDVLMGDEIGTMSIPSLEIGQSTILEFPWNVPNPADYENINNDPWHFCLLARIESADDPMTFPEGSFLTDNVLNNNNIAWKNMTIVDIEPNATSISAALAVGNPTNLSNSYTVNFFEEVFTQGKALYEEAEITIEMDDTFYNAWDSGGRQSSDTNPASIAANNRKHKVVGNSASFENIQFDPGEIGTLTFSFNFLIDEMTTKQKFIYHAEQIDESTSKLIGGETFIVNKQTRDSFAADSGDDKEIERNESATITAAQINEAAIYNWYDPDGTLIYTGTTLTVSPEVTKTYRLEVISDSDGYKDYDEVTVNVAPYRLETLVPNPATNAVSINYMADQATSAYLMVVGTTNNTSNNYILDTTLSTIALDISAYPTGIYAVALVCDGVIADSKQLIKQ